MKINVDRTNNCEGDLVFTITVSQPHSSCFGEFEKKVMDILNICKEDIDRVSILDNKVKNEVIDLIHVTKEKTFIRILENLKFTIENEFRPKFKPICQEIYNWIYDYQTDDLKKWMNEFDPQRTKYYFDNDTYAEKIKIPQQSEHYDEDNEE